MHVESHDDKWSGIGSAFDMDYNSGLRVFNNADATPFTDRRRCTANICYIQNIYTVGLLI